MLEYIIFAGTVAVFLIFAVIYLLPSTKKTTTIPGPEPIDALEGNTPDIISCGSFHEFLVQVHENYGDIASFYIGPQMFISIASAKLFQEHAAVFDRATELFESSVMLIGETSIQVTNGAEGRRRHAAYSKCFTATSVKRYYDMYNKMSAELIKTWASYPKDQFIPLKEQFFAFTIKTIANASFNTDLADEATIKSIHASYDVCMGEIDHRFKGDIPEADGPRDKRFKQHKENFYKVVGAALKQHMANNASRSEGDISIIDAVRSLNLPESTQLSDLLTIFIGGIHTSASLLTWATYWLALYPDIQERAREEVREVVGDAAEITSAAVDQLKYLEQVVNETLRCSIVGPFAGRVQEVDTVLGGHKIPAGTPVVHALGVALHDPNIYEDPDSFDPERFSKENDSSRPPYSFEPFGFAGKRKCPAYRFSLAESMVLLAHLLRSFQINLTPDQEVVPQFGLTSLPKEEVWITVKVL